MTWSEPAPRDGIPGNNGAPITSWSVKLIDVDHGGTIVRSFDPLTPDRRSVDADGLNNGTRYRFSVRSANAVGTSDPVDSDSVVPFGPPFAPENVFALGEHRAASITWQQPSGQDLIPGDNGRPITSYRVLVDPACDACTGRSPGGDVNTTTVTGLLPATEYRFKLVAVNEAGQGAESGVASATTFVEAPDAPGAVTATAGLHNVTVTWGDPALNGSTLSGFEVRVDPACACTGTNVTDPAARSTVIGGLSDGQNYTFAVRATSSAGAGPYSGIVSAAPDSGCRTSSLPAPPAEVLTAAGSVMRRIDVPCIPNMGKVRMGFFIADEEIHFLPGGPVIGRGDGRGPSPGMQPADKRVYVEIDFSKGLGYVQVNESCPDRTQTGCSPARSLVNAFTSVIGPDGKVSIHFSIGDSLISDTPVANNFEVSADIDFTPTPSGQVCVTGSASRYPAIEAYYDTAAGTTTLFQLDQSDLGQWGLALPDRDLPSSC